MMEWYQYIWYASIIKHMRWLICLLQQHLCIYVFWYQKEIPLHHLLKHGMSVKFHIICKIIEMAPDTIQEQGRWQGQHGCALHFAVSTKNVSLQIIWYIFEKWPAIMEECDKDGQTPLHIACKKQPFSLFYFWYIRILLCYKKLMYTVHFHFMFVEGIYMSWPKCCQALLKRGQKQSKQKDHMKIYLCILLYYMVTLESTLFACCYLGFPMIFVAAMTKDNFHYMLHAKGMLFWLLFYLYWVISMGYRKNG